jgi:glycosyltransferase involved in cell wall biosynthesis
MLNLMASFLSAQYEFIPFTTSRPPKTNTIDNWGYSAILRGGIGRLVRGIAITLWHVVKFPFFVLFNRIDIVQIQASDFQTFWESSLYALVARLLFRPVVFRIGGAFDVFHSSSPPIVQSIIAAVLRMPAHIIAQSHSARRYISTTADEKRIVVLPNWPKDEYICAPARADTASPVFLFIAGSEARRKGVDEVLEAARLLDTAQSRARFHVLAAPTVLIEKIDKMHLSNIAKVEGFVTHNHVMEAMRKADVFLLPSHGEGFPNSLIEAMACALPSIVTPVNSVPDIIEHGGACVVPVGDARALADAIDALALEQDARKKMGTDALENLRANFTSQRVLPRLAEIYTKLMTGSSTHR